jgi:hypothetical protein
MVPNALETSITLSNKKITMSFTRYGHTKPFQHPPLLDCGYEKLYFWDNDICFHVLGISD